jgi:hypothetical protein
VGESFAAWLRYDLKELVVVVSVSVVLCVVLALQLLPGPAFEWLTVAVALISIVGSAWLVRRDGQRFWELYAAVYELPGGKGLAQAERNDADKVREVIGP